MSTWAERLQALADVFTRLVEVPPERVVWTWLLGAGEELPDLVPVADAVFLKPQWVPVESIAGGLGPDAPTRRLSLLTVSIFWPKGRGLELVGPVVEELQAALRRQRIEDLILGDPGEPEIVETEGAWRRADIAVQVSALTQEAA